MKNRLLILVLLVFAILLCSCGKDKIAFDEVKEVLPSLVENSASLNTIYFGYGFFPLADASLDEVSGYYYADCSGAGLYSISEIKEATEKVFTAEYAAVLYKNAFDGMADGETVVPPKYIEGAYGIMQSMDAVIYDLPDRKYNFDTLNIVKTDNDRMTVSLESEADGKKSRFELIVVRTENADGAYEYRLDSPTY